ncbi:hypothetical protein CF327_g7821 [Tilletia walkeri]|nr:hypothetical protein CF327_g7821 [Tilletia walkeri]
MGQGSSSEDDEGGGSRINTGIHQALPTRSDSSSSLSSLSSLPSSSAEVSSTSFDFPLPADFKSKRWTEIRMTYYSSTTNHYSFTTTVGHKIDGRVNQRKVTVSGKIRHSMLSEALRVPPEDVSLAAFKIKLLFKEKRINAKEDVVAATSPFGSSDLHRILAYWLGRFRRTESVEEEEQTMRDWQAYRQILEETIESAVLGSGRCCTGRPSQTRSADLQHRYGPDSAERSKQDFLERVFSLAQPTVLPC